MKQYIKQDDVLSPVGNAIAIRTSAGTNLHIRRNRGLYYNNTPLISSPSTPIGEIRMFYGDMAPAGWMICDGSTFDAAEHTDIYNFLGTNVLPDLREIVPSGNSSGGHIFSDDAIGSHCHSASSLCHNHATSGGSHSHSIYCRWPTNGTWCRACICTCSCYKWCLQRTYASSSCYTGSSSAVTSTTGTSCIGLTVQGAKDAVDAMGDVTRNATVGINYVIFVGDQ